MQKAQDDVQQFAKDLQQRGQQFVEDAKVEVQATVKEPITAGVALVIGLLLSIGLYLATTKQKEDPIITFGVFVYGLVAAFLALLLRKKEQKDQFFTMLVFLNVLRVFFDISALATLILSASPAIVNIAIQEVQKHVKTQ